MKCPSENCLEKFEEENVEKVLKPPQFERYKSIKKSALLNQNPNLRWCVRSGCDKFVVGQKRSRKLVCECGMRICFRCGNEYHFGKSCERIINYTYQKYAKDQNVQPCPQCKSRIEKAGGCNHMTCRFEIPEKTLLIEIVGAIINGVGFVE